MSQCLRGTRFRTIRGIEVKKKKGGANLVNFERLTFVPIHSRKEPFFGTSSSSDSSDTSAISQV